MKKLLFCLMAMPMFIVSFAQDSTATGGGSTGAGLPSWFYIAATAIIALYEVLARSIPTLKNYSILSVIIKALNAIVPNRKEGGGQFPQ